MASIYKHRKGWQACANMLGQRIKKNFATDAAAKKWANATDVEMERGHKPGLGGPSKLGGSTALKEMALLKHCFNMAIREWNWTSFANPLVGMKLPTPAPPRDFAFDR